MGDNYRYVEGSVKPIQSAAAGSSSVISKGDFIFDSGSCVPKSAGDFTWDTDLATTQRQFREKFLGLAMDRNRSGDTFPIIYATGGRFEFDCAAATFNPGDLVGPAKQSGSFLEPQKVVAVATADLAIGRVAKLYAANTTRVVVELNPAGADPKNEVQVTKTADFTATDKDLDKVVDNTGASASVNVTLPAPTAARAGRWMEIVSVADQITGFVGGTAGDIATFNNASAASAKLQTSGNKIGGRLRAYCTGAKWHVSNYGANTLTVA